MNRMYGLVLGGCALGALVLVGATPADAKCMKSTASGLGLTAPMAKEMAKINLDTIVALNGKKAKGKVSYKCGAPFVSECKATQRVC